MSPYINSFSFMRTLKIYSLSTFQICNIALLLTIVTMLYIPSPRLTHFIMGSLYLLIPFTHFSHFHCQSRPLETTNMSSASTSLAFVLFRFHISIGLHSICFSVRLISLTIMPSSLSMLSKGKDFLLCYGWILFVCVCVCIYQNSFIHSSINDTEIVSITWLL